MAKNKNRRPRINLEDKRLKNKGIKTKNDTQMKSSKNKNNPKETLRVMAMGGLGEIGKNMYVFEYEDDIVVIDMGFKFPDNEMLGIDYIIPDISYLEERKDKIKGILITHGHEDHIGGIPYILPKLGAPIYAPKLTIGLIEAKLEEFNLAKGAGIHTIDPEKDKIKLGKFEIEWIRVTHSIPDAVAVVVSTPIGKVIFTGDFKFDHSPIDNKSIDIGKFARLGNEGVLLLMSDSTGAESPGYSPSESSIIKNIENVIGSAEGRMIIASFSSQINRIQMIINSTKKHGKKLAFCGRSLLRNVEIAVRLGFLKIPADLIIKIEDVNKYPDRKVCIMSTGSQGEAMSALSRMASGSHRNIKIRKGDTVLFSSSPIPGNETSIITVVDDLFRIGANVIYEDKGQSTHHVSGHPCKEELKMMINLTKPKYFMPVHGERHHQVHHGDIAVETGMSKENIFVMDNGEVLEINKNSARLDGKIQNGIVLVDGLGVGDIGEIVLRDRKAMSTEGIFVVICTVSRKTGKLLTSPDIISRGFIYMRENEKLVNSARNEARRIIENGANREGPQNWANAKMKVRDKIQDHLYQNTQRRPMVIPVIIEV